MRETLTQSAPWPDELEKLVLQCSYRKHEGWRVALDPDQLRDEPDGRGATLVITTCGFDSYHPDRGPNYRVHHYFIVPAATYNRDAWERWLFEQFAKVELHETMENFIINRTDHVTGETLVDRPFAPLHGPGCDPYVVHEYASDEQRRTRFTGELIEPQ